MYQAILAKITELSPIPGADRIQTAFLYDTPCVVSINAAVGDTMVLFPAGGSIDPKFLSANNLYRHSEKNADPAKAGYFEDNGRVKAANFKRTKSDGFAVEPSLFQVAYGEVSLPPVGVPFDKLGEIEVCRKYIKPQTSSGESRGKKVRVKREAPTFCEHLDTDQYRYYKDSIKPHHQVTVSLKMHGTSGRYGYHQVSKALSWWERLLKWFGLPVADTEWQYLVGTRRVIKWDADSPGYHGSEAFRFNILQDLKPYLSKGLSIYGEIVGQTEAGQLIMPAHSTKSLSDKKYPGYYGERVSYLYGTGPFLCDFWIYRITDTTQAGDQFDWTPSQIRLFCDERGLKHVYSLDHTYTARGDEWYNDEDRSREPGLCLGISEDTFYADPRFPSQVAEGVVVRLDTGGRQPRFLKDKTWPFKVMEGIAQEVEGDPEDNA